MIFDKNKEYTDYQDNLEFVKKLLSFVNHDGSIKDDFYLGSVFQNDSFVINHSK